MDTIRTGKDHVLRSTVLQSALPLSRADEQDLYSYVYPVVYRVLHEKQRIPRARRRAAEIARRITHDMLEQGFRYNTH